MRALLIGLALALIAPATAVAGGWMTVGLAPPPADAAAGDKWNAEMTILQHGRTPVAFGPAPILTIRSGDRTERFLARKTDKPGVYRAAVTFPSAGEWSYTVRDPFGAQHSFAPVQVGPGSATPAIAAPGGPSPLPALGIAIAALALLGALGLLALRRSLDVSPR
jgi:hypothetical protein